MKRYERPFLIKKVAHEKVRPGIYVGLSGHLGGGY